VSNRFAPGRGIPAHALGLLRGVHLHAYALASLLERDHKLAVVLAFEAAHFELGRRICCFSRFILLEAPERRHARLHSCESLALATRVVLGARCTARGHHDDVSGGERYVWFLDENLHRGINRGHRRVVIATRRRERGARAHAAVFVFASALQVCCGRWWWCCCGGHLTYEGRCREVGGGDSVEEAPVMAVVGHRTGFLYVCK